MNKKLKETFDLRLIIQVVIILFAVVMAYASLTNHISVKDIHQGYEKLSIKFVNTGSFGDFKTYLDKRLDKIEELIKNER